MGFLQYTGVGREWRCRLEREEFGMKRTRGVVADRGWRLHILLLSYIVSKKYWGEVGTSCPGTLRHVSGRVTSSSRSFAAWGQDIIDQS